jgi:AmmeMemoRadiSam system protein A
MAHLYVELAKESILQEFDKSRVIDKGSYIQKDSNLTKNGACFVTINKRSSLRGCIGSLVAHQPLIDDIIHNAKSAAFGDFRFMPLTKEEFGECEVEISVLSEPKELEYEDETDLKRKIRVGVDGVILSLNGKRATFLPSVWEQLPTFELFFAHLCQKAGLPHDCLYNHPKIETYQAKKYV